MALLVSYDLKGPRADYHGLIEELKRGGHWWHHLESTWIVGTQESPDQLYERLEEHIDRGKGDELLIIELSNSARRQGWLPEKAWKWITNHIGG